MEWVEGILLIAASGVGAVCGIMGQTIKDWISRPIIHIGVTFSERTSAVTLYFANFGRKSTEDLDIDIMRYEGGIPMGNGKVIYHTDDLTLHPKTMHFVNFGCLEEDNMLRIRKSDFGKIVKYTHDSDEEKEEWVFLLPAEFYISACARDAKARGKVLLVDEKGARLSKPKGIHYSQLKQASLFDEK
jgi:hypothetical protein